MLEFTYLGDRVSAGGGCEAAVSTRTYFGWVKFWKCSELLYGRRFSLWLKGAVYNSYVWPAILYGSVAWCLKENEMAILRRTEISMMRAMCGVLLKDKEISKDVMLDLHETIELLAMANTVHWYDHVLSREDGHVLRSALDFEFEGQRRKGRLKGTWQLEEESVKVAVRREDALCRSKCNVGLWCIWPPSLVVDIA